MFEFWIGVLATMALEFLVIVLLGIFGGIRK